MIILFLLAILIILLSLLLLCVAIIIFPIKYDVNFEYGQELSVTARFHVLSCISICSDTYTKKLKIYIGPLRLLSFNVPGMKSEGVESEDKKRKGGFSFKSININKIKSIIKEIKPGEVVLQGVYGFEDPDVTGIICGIIYSLQGAGFPVKLDLYPDFTGETTCISINLKGNVVIRRFITILLDRRSKNGS